MSTEPAAAVPAAAEDKPSRAALITEWASRREELNHAKEREHIARAEREAAQRRLDTAQDALLPICPSDGRQAYFLLKPTNDGRRAVVHIHAYNGAIYAALEYAEVL